MRPVFCFCSIGFRDNAIEDVVRDCAEIGYDAIEIWHQHVAGKSDAELAALGDHAQKHNIRLEVISPYLWLTQDMELLERSYGNVDECLHIAKILGIKKFRTFTDSGPSGIGSAVVTPEQRQQAVQALKEITARDRSVTFVVETHEKTLADDPRSMLKLLEEVGADNLKVLFQPLAPQTMLQEYNLLKDHVEHIHLHNTGIDGGNGWIDEGEFDFPTLLDALKNNNYSNTMSVEYCFKGGSTYERATQALNYLNRHFK